MKILNLYAGIGGNRKLWDKPLKEKFGNDYQITAIEYNEEIAAIYKDFFPNDEVIVTDAHQYLLEHFKEFDFIWSSPPCQSHSSMINVNHKLHGFIEYPDMSLYQQKILLDNFYKGLFLIENVKPYYIPLIEPTFKLERHLFWSNFKPYTKIELPKIKNFIDAKSEDIQNWLGIRLNKKLYAGRSNDPNQVLRNCVHPKIGLHILNRALEIKESEEVQQGKLFV